MEIKFGKKPGELQLSLGKSLVIAKIKTKIVTPYKHKDRQGFLKFNVDLSVMKQEQQKSGQFSSKNLSIEIS